MINRQLYTMKFQSSRLKKFNYNIEIDYQQALENDEIINLSDNQLLRTIRAVVINKAKDKKEVKHRVLDRNLLEEFYRELKIIRRRKNSPENIKNVKQVKNKIIDMCFIPEYITIVMNHNSHYDYLFNNGLKINGVKYFRLSTSAGQGRVSTVAFCSSDVLEAVNEILDNGRDKNKKMSPSKFNAYKGTYGSSTKIVTTPRICVVKDYESELTFKVNFVTETEGEQDDDIREKYVTKSFNRFDGQGLISPKMAKVWSIDLDLDHVPAEFCIRQSFLKGMVCVFDFYEFCRTENGDNYMIESIYKDDGGNSILVDLRDIDLILTESQFKLWDSYSSLDEYIKNCEVNDLKWGVSLYTDQEINRVLNYNYQFLQVLDLKKEDIPKLCEYFVDWINGVNVNNIWYTLIFLIGTHITEGSIKKYLEDNRNYWIKSLIVNHELINDKYIKKRIYDLIKTKIENGCIGRIILKGNNQTIVSDPYAMMQHVCGHEKIDGLLGERQYYSHYWNEEGVSQIVGTRPPLTYRSETLKMNLVKTKEQQKWYKYLYGGIILNIHGHETDNFAGSDFDFDFLSTTDNEIILKSIYKDELPVIYNPPLSEKIVFNEKDLFISDKFSFGSIIGAITNRSTTALALLDSFRKKYGEDSREYRATLNRVKMCTKLQSAQIDKTKIGKEVKGIPKIWVNRKYIDGLDIEESEKEFLKSIMLDRHPYFFIHLYHDTKKKHKSYIEGYNISCIHKFSMGINELMKKEDLTQEEKEYIDMFHEYMPVVDSDSPMNNICKYIENVNFNIKEKIKYAESKDIHLILMRNNKIISSQLYYKVLDEYKKFKKELSQFKRTRRITDKSKFNKDVHNSTNAIYEIFKDRMDGLCSNVFDLVDCLIKIFYVEHVADNKALLWNAYGDIILENLKDKNKNPIFFPFLDPEGNIEYLNHKFSLKEVVL